MAIGTKTDGGFIYTNLLFILILLNLTKVGLQAVVNTNFVIFRYPIYYPVLLYLGIFAILYGIQFIPVLGTVFFILIILYLLFECLNVYFYLRDLEKLW
ncbi:MAG: hypothetical protein J0L62_07745 [Bacteroidetes bacterium]|nr:hypothetical protein [Bacteroidota bacterium]